MLLTQDFTKTGANRWRRSDSYERPDPMYFAPRYTVQDRLDKRRRDGALLQLSPFLVKKANGAVLKGSGVPLVSLLDAYFAGKKSSEIGRMFPRVSSAVLSRLLPQFAASAASFRAYYLEHRRTRNAVRAARSDRTTRPAMSSQTHPVVQSDPIPMTKSSPEDLKAQAKAKARIALLKAAEIMGAALERGDLDPDKLSESLKEYREKSPY